MLARTRHLEHREFLFCWTTEKGGFRLSKSPGKRFYLDTYPPWRDVDMNFEEYGWGPMISNDGDTAEDVLAFRDLVSGFLGFWLPRDSWPVREAHLNRE